MVRLLAGIIVGAVLAVGAGLAFQQKDPCLGRCGEGTACEGGRCVVTRVAAPAPVAPAPVGKKRKRGSGTSGSGMGDPAAPEIVLQPGDTDRMAQGDALGRPEHIDLTEAGPDGKDLTQEDMDKVMARAEPAIVRCITQAIGDAPLDEGTIEVGMRIDRDGSVDKVRVEGPKLLQQHGLYKCVRGVVTGVRFPASGGATVATFPYAIR